MPERTSSRGCSSDSSPVFANPQNLPSAGPSTSENLSAIEVPADGGTQESSVSLREIRQKAVAKGRVSTLTIPHRLEDVVSSGSNPTGDAASPSKSRILAPRSAGGQDLRSSSPAEPLPSDDGDGDGDDDETAKEAKIRLKSRRMTMLDFLAAEAPPVGRSASSDHSRGLTSSVSGPSLGADLSPLGNTSLPLSASTPHHLNVAPSNGEGSSRARPRSMITTSPTKAKQQPRDEFARSDPKGSGMSAFDFLATEPPAWFQSGRQGSDEVAGTSRKIRSRPRTSEPNGGRKQKSAADSPHLLNEPLPSTFSSLQQHRQQRKKEECEVTVAVNPVVDTLTMFGSTQTSANYSLSGSVVVKLPRPRPRAPADVDAVGAGRELTDAGVSLKSLKVTFTGFSIYADLAGRYSGIKLCEVTQELLVDGAALPLPSDAGTASAATEASESLKYEIQFDLNIPGWLPGSAFARFGATFYCISASAIATHSPSVNSDNRSPGFELNDMWTAEPESIVVNSSLDSALQGTQTSDASGGPRDDSDRMGRRASMPSEPAAENVTGKQKGKSSWLSKRAKQLSLKSKATDASTAGGERDSPVPTALPSLTERLDGSGRVPQADGSVLIKGEKQLIIIRRCRDVVPVPVARLAIVGEALPAGAQDPPPPPPASAPAFAAPAAMMPHQPPTRVASIEHHPAATHEVDREQALPGPRSDSQAPMTAVGTDVLVYNRTAAEGSPAAETTSRTQSTELSMSAASAPAQNGERNAAVTAAASYDATTPASPSTNETITSTAAGPAPLPVAPSIFTAPADPAKQAAAARNPPPPPIRTSSAAITNPPDHNSSGPAATAEAGSGAPPMRHFLHRPILHPPTDSGIEDGDGLPFSLTISVPSHIQVQNADVLTFGVQVEVGRTTDWIKVRELGGLRLRDMELICTQSERHTSVPSRTFCATFPVPPEPKVKAFELPILPKFTHPLDGRALQSSHEVKVRNAYDPDPIVSHLAMLDSGKSRPQEQNDVERIRSNIVGPPPNFQQDKQGQNKQSQNQQANGSLKGKGKDKEKKSRKVSGSGQTSVATSSNGEPSGSSTPVPLASAGASLAHAQPMFADQMSRSGTPTQADTSAGETSSEARDARAVQPRSSLMTGGGRSRTTSSTMPSLNPPSGPSDATVPFADLPLADGRPPPPEPIDVAGAATAYGGASGPESPTTPRRMGRGRRAYQAAVRGLSTFATAMMEVGYDETGSSSVVGGSRGAQQAGFGPQQNGQDQPRASYTFAGEDGHGVDLTKGRIRMTVNLPLVPASATAARRDGMPQLLSDYESPHMRIRHKLKVKLGFGFGAKPLGGEGDWGQALVMCVPVRFTEAPPREVKEQFAPMPITVTTDGETSLQPTVSVSDPGAAPVLPAYTQLFRDDGSRLNEAEDLPAYPGPRRPPVGTAAVGLSSPRLNSRPSYLHRPSLPHRGSVTGPRLPSASDAEGSGSIASTSSPLMAALPSPVLPPMNSLAPEHVVDEAIRGIVDPDESMAEMREQEREMREWAEGADEESGSDPVDSRDRASTSVLESLEHQQQTHSPTKRLGRLRGASFISIGGSARMHGSSASSGPSTSATTTAPSPQMNARVSTPITPSAPTFATSGRAGGHVLEQQHATIVGGGGSGSVFENRESPDFITGDTVLIGAADNEDEDRARAREEELGL